MAAWLVQGRDRREEDLSGLHQLVAIPWGMQTRWEGWGVPSIAGEDAPGDTDPPLAVSAQGSELRRQQQKQQQRQPNSVSQLEKPAQWTSRVSPVALAWHRLVQGELGASGVGASSQRSLEITRESPPCCFTPSLRRCWGWRGTRRSARRRRSARSDTRRRRCAWGGAGCGGTRCRPWSRYVLRHTLLGTGLGTAVARDAESHRATWRGGRGGCRQDGGQWHMGGVQG